MGIRQGYGIFRRDVIGFIFQEHNLIEGFTVYKNLSIALELQGQDVNHDKIMEALEILKGPAVIAFISAVLGAIIGASIKFFTEVYFPRGLEDRRQILITKRKYSNPILKSADELLSRLENIIIDISNIKEKRWLRPPTDEEITMIPFKRYYYISTIFCFAQLIGWIEILRKEQSYLDFTSVKETRIFNQYIKLIYDVLNYKKLSTEDPRLNIDDSWIFSHRLRSIGQIMIQRKDGNLYCMDFKTFCEAFKGSKSSEFRDWLSPLSRLIEDLSDDPNDLRWRRLQITYVIIRAYINFVDPKHIKSQLKIKDYDEILADPTNVFKAVQKRGETYDLKLEFPDIKCT